MANNSRSNSCGVQIESKKKGYRDDEKETEWNEMRAWTMILLAYSTAGMIGRV